MITIDGLTRRFGDVTAVDSLTLTIDEGEVFGLLGPNGAGKTTTIRMLAGLIGKTAGDAWVAGCRVGHPATARQLRSLVGLMPEEAGLYPDLSAARTLDFYGRLYQVSAADRAERTERLLTMLDLWDRRDVRVRTFSKGMKQRLTIARALINDPPVLFLDEPTANLDPEGAKVVRDFLLRLRQEKRTILLNTHQLAEAERVCDRVGILRTRLIAVGTPDALRSTASPPAEPRPPAPPRFSSRSSPTPSSPPPATPCGQTRRRPPARTSPWQATRSPSPSTSRNATTPASSRRSSPPAARSSSSPASSPPSKTPT